MFAKVVVAYDGSDYSDRALGSGIEIVKRFNSNLTILTVAPIHPEVGEAPGLPPKIEAREVEAYRAMAEKAATRARTAGATKVKVAVRQGVVVEQILRFLQTANPDLVIVGSRGQSTFRGLLLGSVSEAVIHHASCPTLVQK